MASDTVQLNWNPEEQFVLSDKEDFKIKMKRPGGVKPSDMLAMALKRADQLRRHPLGPADSQGLPMATSAPGLVWGGRA